MSEAAQADEQHTESLQHHYEALERRRRLLLLNLFNGIAGFFLFSFGVSAILAGRTSLAAVTLTLGVVAVINLLLLKFTGNQRIVKFLFVVGVLYLVVYELVSGGVNGTGPLWCYPGLAGTVYILGTRRGLPTVAVMFVIAVVVFYVPIPNVEVASYSYDFKIRFVSTFLMLAIFVALHEYARAKDQKELYRVSGKLDHLSKLDQLTGLPNRRYMTSRLEAENSRYLRHKRPYSILYGDIDNFKEINDRFGHQTGDEVLRTIAQTIRTTVRQHDEVCRWGGEEFLVMLPETDQQMAIEVAEKLCETIASINFGASISNEVITMSFGVHTVNCEGGIDTFIHLADEKLYLAKHAGKNRVVSTQAVN